MESGIANNFVTYNKSLNKKQLLLFPCNPGALVGDYFKSKTWLEASLYFPERTTTMDFAAVDCIRQKVGGGLIVFENEMERVKGFDVYPIYSEEKVKELDELMKLSIPKLKGYEKIYVYLNVRLYKEVVEANKLSNMVFVDIPFNIASFAANLVKLRELVGTLSAIKSNQKSLEVWQ